MKAVTQPFQNHFLIHVLKIKFPIENFFSKYDDLVWKLRIHLSNGIFLIYLG